MISYCSLFCTITQHKFQIVWMVSSKFLFLFRKKASSSSSSSCLKTFNYEQCIFLSRSYFSFSKFISIFQREIVFVLIYPATLSYRKLRLKNEKFPEYANDSDHLTKRILNIQIPSFNSHGNFKFRLLCAAHYLKKKRRKKHFLFLSAEISYIKKKTQWEHTKKCDGWVGESNTQIYEQMNRKYIWNDMYAHISSVSSGLSKWL